MRNWHHSKLWLAHYASKASKSQLMSPARSSSERPRLEIRRLHLGGVSSKMNVMGWTRTPVPPRQRSSFTASYRSPFLTQMDAA